MPNGLKHVIVTTHSPVLIDYVSPEDIHLVWRQDGKTSVSPLDKYDPDVAQAWANGQIDLFNYLDSGLIREVVPGGVG